VNAKVRHKRYIAGGFAIILAGTAAFSWNRAGAGALAFEEVPAATNISALKAAPAATVPSTILSLPVDMQPSGPVRELGNGAGYGWIRNDGSVCVLMSEGPAGCLTTFRKPVLLYLAGVHTAAGVDTPVQVWGIVPDAVARLSLVTDRGDTVTTNIVANAFRVTLPPTTSILGERVTLTSGVSFYQDDLVSGEPAIPPPPAAG
jgi:hypothetical protein